MGNSDHGTTYTYTASSIMFQDEGQGRRDRAADGRENVRQTRCPHLRIKGSFTSLGRQI